MPRFPGVPKDTGFRCTSQDGDIDNGGANPTNPLAQESHLVWAVSRPRALACKAAGLATGTVEAALDAADRWQPRAGLEAQADRQTCGLVQGPGAEGDRGQGQSGGGRADGGAEAGALVGEMGASPILRLPRASLSVGLISI